MRVLAVCRECCEVHAAGAECPRCSGKPVPPLLRKPAEPPEVPVNLRFGRPHLVGIAVGLAAAAGVLSIFGGL
jgi:hypothetical protein